MSRRLIPIHRGHLVSDPFNFLRQEIDRLFESSSSVQGIRPEFEVKENKDGIQLTAELPGISEKDIEVSLAEGILTISGEKKSEDIKDGETYHIAERSYGTFTRSIKLPYEPEEKKISASFKDGVLRLVIPRPEKSKPNIHKILIQKP
ncbi:MAG: Hsp20/alpha crystallin family protein [Alphaproteobacteria bacterium]|nr:Hsp20/alpha crystallin family protein [Alphaproteobacteria bacterium]